MRHASKKQGGSSSNGRDSNPKYLGIKKYGGEHVRAGNIIARQRGLKWWGGANVGVGKDHTLFALIEGRVHFTDAKNTHKPGKKVANVVPHEEWPRFSPRHSAETRRVGAEPTGGAMNVDALRGSFQSFLESVGLAQTRDPGGWEYWHEPERCGWLMKQGDVIKTWRRRWFVLKQGKLFWFLGLGRHRRRRRRAGSWTWGSASAWRGGRPSTASSGFELSSRVEHQVPCRGQREGEGGVDQRAREGRRAAQQVARRDYDAY